MSYLMHFGLILIHPGPVCFLRMSFNCSRDTRSIFAASMGVNSSITASALLVFTDKTSSPAQFPTVDL